MADNVTHIGENSPEEVAYKLMLLISKAEKKGVTMVDGSADRKWILDTYAECLFTVRAPAHRLPKKPVDVSNLA